MSKLTPKNMLITGGAGFIGTNFVRYLLNQHTSINIINLDALTYAGSYNNVSDLAEVDNYRFIKGNILDKALLVDIFKEYSIDTVVHFAAESHVDRSISEPEQFILTNILGTFYLLETARGFWEQNFNQNKELCRFHHISTDEVYGSLKQNDPPFTELSSYLPNSPYSASKASSDFLVRAYFKTYNLPYTLSNCSNNFGPYQHSEKFVPTIIKACLAQKPIPIYGDGSNIRDWLYVEDHCNALDKILREGTVGNNYNIGGNNEISNLDLALHICRLMDEIVPATHSYQQLISFVPDRPGHDWRYAICTKKIHKELGWVPSLDFNHQLRQTIDWFINTLK